VTKCDTNTSPRRLATHLLQLVDQSFTLRRHSGHGTANATRNNTSAKNQTTIAKASKASSEYHTMEALCGGPGYTDMVGCRAATYSTSSRTKSGSSSEKQLVKQGCAHTYSTSPTPPTEGLINRVMHMVYQGSGLRFICKHIYSCRGSFRKGFRKSFL
jgi:hypothetical protein